MNNKDIKRDVICEILLELELTINEDSNRDQVAGMLHRHIEALKLIPNLPFTIGKISGDYSFSVPGDEPKPEPEDDPNDLTKDPTDMIKV